jgi:hypothetical protein
MFTKRQKQDLLKIIDGIKKAGSIRLHFDLDSDKLVTKDGEDKPTCDYGWGTIEGGPKVEEENKMKLSLDIIKGNILALPEDRDSTMADPDQETDENSKPNPATLDLTDIKEEPLDNEPEMEEIILDNEEEDKEPSLGETMAPTALTPAKRQTAKKPNTRTEPQRMQSSMKLSSEPLE